MYPLKQSSSLDVCFFAFDSSGDGVTGKVNGDFTKRISKNGAAFAAMTVTITEMENGFYAMTLSSSHTDTLGILTVSLSASGIKRVNLQYRVTARLVDDVATQTSLDTLDDYVDSEVAAIKAKTDQLTFTTANQVDCQPISIAASAITATSIATDAITAAKIATDAITSAELAASAVTEIQSGLSTLDAAGVRSAVGLASANLDTQLTAIDDFLDTEIAAIKAVTDLLTLNGIADAIMKRDMSAITGESSRSLLNAIRFLRNKWSLSAGTLTVTKEDDSTSAWTASVSTDAAAVPVIGSDPA